MRMHYNCIFNHLSSLMGSVISQSLNIKTKIVYDLSSFGEQDSVSSASVSPLWPEVTNYSVISHLSCLSFHHRMSIYTTLNNSLYLLLWIAHAGEDPLDGQSGQALQYEGELHVVRGPGEELHHQPVGLLDREDSDPVCWGQLSRTHFLRQWVKLRWRDLLQPRLMIPGHLITIVPSRFCSPLSLHLLAGQWGGALGREGKNNESTL